MTKFSIFLPVRNGWPYVQECVESILRQTYPYFELNVLDNQSSDNTVPWLKSLTDNRIRLWTSSAALSIEDSWTRIKGIEKQEFMTMIGHDDILEPNFLGIIKNMIDLYPDAALYQTGGCFINTKGKTIRSIRPIPERETAVEYITARLTFQRDISGTGYVMRSADYDRVGGIPPFEKLFFADDALWLSLMLNSYKVCNPAKHYAIRTHSKSTSASLSSKWLSIVRGLNQFVTFLNHFAENDGDSRTAITALLPEFLLIYHRNAYLYALVEACHSGQKIVPEVFERIERSLIACAPSVSSELRRSVKVSIIEGINASPLRKQISLLWDVYYCLKTKDRGV